MGKETISRKTIAKGVVSGVVALASLGALQVGEYTLPAEPTEAETSAETEASAVGTDAGAESGSSGEETAAESVSYENGFTPGTYTASAKGMESDVTAVCTFDETSLTDVSLDVSGETQGIGAAAGDELTAAFLSAQSPEIDGVSGATVTSTAAKTAVSDCFSQAAVSSGETEQAAETEASDDDAAAGENETEAAEEGDAAEEADANAVGSSGAYTPGTYTASAKGLESDVTAVCTFDETGLTAISLDVSGETPDIGGAIGDEMIAAILNAQSAEVDGVSGATVTSTAVKTAVSECYALAAGGAGGESADSGETEEATEAAEETETEAAGETETGSAAEGESAAGAYTPGTYTATAAGISSDVTVTLTFDEGAITEMTVDVSGETAGIGADIGDTVIEQVLTAQSAEIDGVSGATVTSTAVKTAVLDCLSQAAAGSSAEEGAAEQTAETESAEETDTEAETTDAAEIETEAAAEEEATDAAGIETEAAAEEEATDAAEIETEAAAEEEATDAAEIETEAAAEEENTNAAETETEAAADEENGIESTGAYTPGIYTASAKGLESDVIAVCTFDETGLTAISLDVSGETPDIGGAIGTEMSSAILNAQSAEVDDISGATVTSTAVKTAVSECFAQAAGESGSAEANAEADGADTESEVKEAATEAADNATEAETEMSAYQAQAAGSYSPGTYTASASSSVGDVTAFCTFSDSGLIAISLEGTSGGIADTLEQAILDAQSAKVDSISGAPETSAAVMEAVQSCFDQAAAGN